MKNIFLMLPELQNVHAHPWYDCGNGVIMKRYGGASAADLLYLCEKAEEIGFVLFDKRESEGNLFYTYRADNAFLHMYYIPCEQTVRVIMDDASAEYTPISPDDPPSGTTTLWQFETDHTFIDCGMCYILKCPDGSFFVIDSGHYCAVQDGKRLYRFLRERTPENEKIILSGWLFTHGHDDHICVFMDLMRDGHEDLIVKKLYYNFVPVTHADNGCWKRDDKDVQLEFEAYVASLGIPVVKPHSGQCFRIGGLAVNILCTHEDIYPGSLENYNDSSIVFTVSGKNFRVCIPGDAGHAESDIVTGRFTESTLKSDVVQAAHHGHFGATKSFYQKVCAPVILYPNTRIKFDEEYIRYEENPYAVGLAKRCYVSSEGTVEIPLPLDLERIKVYPDETDEDFEAIRKLWGYTYTDDFIDRHKAEFKKRQLH